MDIKKRNKSAALRFANSVREALGKPRLRKLPLGIPFDNCKCPVALAVEDSQARVDEDNFTFENNAVKCYVVGIALDYDDISLDETEYYGLKIPPDVSKFVKDFDNGKYPELIDIQELVRGYSS